MFVNSLKVIKIDRNLSELRQIVRTNLIVTLVFLLVLFFELPRVSCDIHENIKTYILWVKSRNLEYCAWQFMK